MSLIGHSNELKANRGHWTTDCAAVHIMALHSANESRKLQANWQQRLYCQLTHQSATIIYLRVSVNTAPLSLIHYLAVTVIPC